MKCKENETVRIIKDFKDNVKKNDVGVVLMAFEKPREAYEVEVLNENGEPKAQCTLLPNDLELFMTSKENCERKKIVEIDLTAVQNAEELHSLLKKHLDFPSFYGMNWNAFWDAITGLVDLPERLVLVGWNDMANKLPEDAKIMKYYLDKYEEKYKKHVKCIFEYK